MDYRDRSFRNEPEMVGVDHDFDPRQSSDSDQKQMPEANSARAEVASRVRHARIDDGAGRVQGNAGAKMETALGGDGSSLDQQTQEAASKSGLGDLSGVRIHTDSAAAEAANALGAKAVTLGNDIFFNQGRFEPGTNHGDQLLGHELAHAAQQSGQQGQVATKLELSTPGNSSEVEADQAGGVFARAAAGQMVDHARITSTGMAMARDTETQPASSETDDRILNQAQIASAVAFNNDRNLPSEAWAQIGRVVGSSSSSSDGTMAEAIAQFQKSQSFEADGKAGSMTIQRISQSPGGEGLDEHVKSDAILFLGLNPSSRGVETQTLKNSAGASNVTSITGSSNQDSAVVGGRRVDLNQEQNMEKFAQGFPLLDPARQQKLIDFVNAVGWSGMDETAMLMRVLYEAEFGMRLMKRVVLSGHSGGWSIWGDDNGSLDFQHMSTMGAIFPNAVGQVEDLMLSACNTGYADNIPMYQAMFPNVKSIWAYVGYSPSAATGSTRHIQKWEKATRGKMSHDAVNSGRETVASGHGKRDKNVAIWTKEGGAAAEPQYETDSPYLDDDFDSLRATVSGRMVYYESALEQGIINQSELDDLYVQVQTLVGNYASSLSEEEHSSLTVAMKKLLFLRHYSTVARKFWEENGSIVRSAYQAAGQRDVPPYGTEGRLEMLAHVQSFPGDRGGQAYELLQAILVRMEPDRIPDNWV